MAARSKGSSLPVGFESHQITGTPHWIPTWCAAHHFENLEKGNLKCPHGCPPGPMIRMLWTVASEILGGGARGGAKTETGRGFLLKGNPGEISHHPNGEHIMYGYGDEAYCGICVNLSYIAHPRYRALVLRENEKDLADWISRARLLYTPMGAEVTEKPARVKWPSGATFVLGHMKDENAYTDYMGQEFHRIIFEELTQIESEELYKSIRASCRSTFRCFLGCRPGQCVCGRMDPQSLATSNPGNKGHLWVKKRFIDVGKPNEIYTDPKSGLTRIYVPAKVTDNPYLMRDNAYLQMLDDLPEPRRSMWLLGDWDALGGQYFRDFRPKGPLTGDPPEARHVIPTGSRYLAPWFLRWIGGDWGYDHGYAFYGFCLDQKDVITVYREITGRETGSRELGAHIARQFFPDLLAMEKEGIEPSMTLWLSPDAFAKDDEGNTTAMNIGEGINSVLGPGAAFFPELWGEKGLPVLNTVSQTSIYTPGRLQNVFKTAKFRIVILRAKTDRVLGWQHMRELLRFKQLSEVQNETFDSEYAATLLHQDIDLYRSYLKGFEARKPEILPRLLIYDCCKHLIEAIPTAVYKDGTEDVQKVATIEDDCLDGCRYGLYSQSLVQHNEPKSSFIHRELDRIREMEPGIDYNGLVWAARQAEEKFKQGEASRKPFNVPVEASRGFHKYRRQRTVVH